MSEQSYWAVVEPVWLRLNRSWDEDPNKFLRLFGGVPAKAGHLYAAHWCQSEVCNGGLHQLFYNTTGILAPEGAAGFAALEMPEVASVLERAMAVFGTPYPRRRSVRQRALPLAKAFEALDDEFLAAFKGDRWVRAADRYAKSEKQG